ncbi:MAG: Smr/MutS family protein [Pseudomonadota bacterium]
MPNFEEAVRHEGVSTADMERAFGRQRSDEAPLPEARVQATNAPNRRATAAAVVERGRERKVRRGQVPIAARLDLHGHTQSSADQTLRHFVAQQRQSGARCVLVITGKGRDGTSVLKRNFLAWLESPSARAMVSGVAEAHPRHGGSGAFYVWLRRC